MRNTVILSVWFEACQRNIKPSSRIPRMASRPPAPLRGAWKSGRRMSITFRGKRCILLSRKKTRRASTRRSGKVILIVHCVKSVLVNLQAGLGEFPFLLRWILCRRHHLIRPPLQFHYPSMHNQINLLTTMMPWTMLLSHRYEKRPPTSQMEPRHHPVVVLLAMGHLNPTG